MFIISFEGPDMTGKSTQVNNVRKILEEDMCLKVKTVHFPRYDTPIGRCIKLVLDGEIKMDMIPLQMLYIADQTAFSEEIREYEKEYDVLLLDRYDLSTIAYASSKENSASNRKLIQDILRSYQKEIILPDLTLIFSKNSNFNLHLFERGGEKDIFEKDAFMMKNIDVAYEEIAEQYIRDDYSDGRKIAVINANNTIDKVTEDIMLEIITKI